MTGLNNFDRRISNRRVVIDRATTNGSNGKRVLIVVAIVIYPKSCCLVGRKFLRATVAGRYLLGEVEA